jgi:hypothetical protein
MEKENKNKPVQEKAPTKENIKIDIVEIVGNWDKYKPNYEQTINHPTEKRLYRLEKEAVGPDHVATTWIARTLRTVFGHNKYVIDEHIDNAVEELISEKKFDCITTKPLDSSYTPFDGPAYQNFITGRRGLRLRK